MTWTTHGQLDGPAAVPLTIAEAGLVSAAKAHKAIAAESRIRASKIAKR